MKYLYKLIFLILFTLKVNGQKASDSIYRISNSSHFESSPFTKLDLSNQKTAFVVEFQVADIGYAKNNSKINNQNLHSALEFIVVNDEHETHYYYPIRNDFNNDWITSFKKNQKRNVNIRVLFTLYKTDSSPIAIIEDVELVHLMTIDISKEKNANYILSNIIFDKTYEKKLWNGAIYLKSYTITDSKATSKDFSEGSDEILSSVLISLTPDGDYYTNSNLYKIEGICNPKIIEITELSYPEFSIKIEYGNNNNRITEVVNFKYSNN